MRHTTVTIATVAVLLHAGVPSLLAQERSGVVGTITDGSGAVVPGAVVTVINTGTNLRRMVTTNDSGDYFVPNLPVGDYTVSVEKEGFKTSVVSDLHLNVQVIPRVNVVLEIGTISDRVNVIARAPLLETTSAQIGTIVDNKRLVELPLNGRNFTQLTLLVPGVVESKNDYVATYSLATRGTGVSFTVNGQSSQNNQYLLDGVPIKEYQHQGAAFSPSIEAVQEFQVQTSNYGLEFAAEGGAHINLVSKSGTNAFHGAAFEFVRNDKFDARNYFAPTKPPLRRHQFGGTLGGPVLKDKLFFFGSYEGMRIRRGFTQTGTVPDSRMRNGDFSALLAQGITIVDPLTGAPFPGNVLPSNRLSPVTKTVLDRYVPEPNSQGNPAFNWVSVESNKINTDQYLGRVDYLVGPRDQIYARYIQENVSNVSPKFFPTDSFIQHSRGLNGMVGYTHTFGGSAVNEFKFAYNRHTQDEVVGRAFQENVVGLLGLQGLCEEPACWGIPQMSVSGFSEFGEHGQGQVVSGPRAWRNEIFHFNQLFTLMKGSHLVKMGLQYNRHHDTFPEAIFPRGLYSFDGRFTNPAGTPRSVTALADFLLGYPRSQTSSIDIFDPKFTNNVFYPFIEDVWKVSRNLTLNLGLSYWNFGRPVSADNSISNIDFSTNPPQLVTARETDSNGFPRALIEPDSNNFAPKVQFAWVPFGHAKAVVRGGYNVAYQRATINYWIDLAINPPFVRQQHQIIEQSNVAQYDMRTAFVNVPPIPLLTFAQERAWKDGYVQQWNLTTQYQPAKQISLTLGYVANKGTKLPFQYDVNLATPGPGSVQSRRPYQNFGTIYFLGNSLSSTYHSLQATVERRYSDGFSFLGSYTWAKCLDNFGFQDPRVRQEKGRCSGDIRHSLVISYLYELPFTASRYPIVDALVKGWQLSGIATFRSGLPFSVFAPGDWANVGGSARAELVGDWRLDDPTTSQWFRREAFTTPALGSFGNSGRNILTGPGYANVDLGLQRNFAIGRGGRLMVRLEVFNAFNRANFDLPGTTVGSASYGIITSAGDARQVQLGIRYSF